MTNTECSINPGRLGIFDSHAHYDDAAFADDLADLVAEMKENGVTGIINGAVDYDSCEKCIGLCDRYDLFYTAVGVHPENLYADARLDRERLIRLAQHPKVVAIGEIGLDYHWDTFPRDYQKQWFADQLLLANELKLPVIVHDREAHGDTMELLKAHRPAGAVHCFSGSREMAEELIKLGMYLGIGGVVTFQNARKTVEVVKELPLNRLLLETDAPYLSPVPMRGKRCRSDYISFTAERIAEIKGISPKEVLEASRANIHTLFGI